MNGSVLNVVGTEVTRIGMEGRIGGTMSDSALYILIGRGPGILDVYLGPSGDGDRTDTPYFAWTGSLVDATARMNEMNSRDADDRQWAVLEKPHVNAKFVASAPLKDAIDVVFLENGFKNFCTYWNKFEQRTDHSIRKIAPPVNVRKEAMNCYAYSLELYEEQRYLDLVSVNGDINLVLPSLGQSCIERLISLNVLSAITHDRPPVGALAIYRRRGGIVHCARVIDVSGTIRVRSKNNQYDYFEHDVNVTPAMWGKELQYYSQISKRSRARLANCLFKIVNA
jgi:hypothetical protein